MALRDIYRLMSTCVPAMMLAMVLGACIPAVDGTILPSDTPELPIAIPTTTPTRITRTPPPTITPTPTRSPFFTPIPLSTLAAPVELALPPAATLDEFRAAMRSGSEANLQEMAGLPSYRIAMRLDDQTGVLEGREEVLFTNRTGIPLESLLFRLYPNYVGLVGGFEHGMQVGGVRVDGAPARSEYAASNTGLLVYLSEPLLPEESVAVEISYSMLLPPIKRGAWELEYPHPMLAVHDEGGWREDLSTAGDVVYSESGMYTLEITLPTGIVLAASGTETSRRSNDDGTISAVILAPGMRDIAVMPSDSLQRSSQTTDGVTINLWHTANDPLVDEKLATISDAMRTFDRFFGIYPYNELDMVTFYDPEWQGPTGAGMQHCGLGRYTHSSVGWEFHLVHEVSHQWWFGVVGNDTQMEPWLDEAMAEYSAFLYFLEFYGEQEASRAFEANVTADYQMWLEQGAIDGTEPVGLSVYDFPAFQGMYSWIIYGKGALFLDELRARMGETVFLEFLQEYYRRFMYDVATGEEFLQVANEVSRRNFADLYDEWVRK